MSVAVLPTMADTALRLALALIRRPVWAPSLFALVATAWMTGCRLPIALKVLSSWLIAVAALAATLLLLPVTPGYLPDHLE